MILLFMVLHVLQICGQTQKSEDHYCLKFSVDTKSDYKFVTVQIGTPLVPYRLLICPEPKIKRMNFYQVVMFGSSFGGAITGSTSGRFQDKNSAMDLFDNSNDNFDAKFGRASYYSDPWTNIHSSMYSRKNEVLSNSESFSKSVTFDMIYSDGWSTIGKDFSRTIDGIWVEIGIEVSNLKSTQQVFDSYCNPGGLGDTAAVDYMSVDSGKYGTIDGFFITGSTQTFLLAGYDLARKGYSTTIINNNLLKYCYQTSPIPDLLLNFHDSTSVASGKLIKKVDVMETKVINLNAERDGMPTKMSESVYSNMYKIDVTKKGKRNFNGNSKQTVKNANVQFTRGKLSSIPKFTVDSNVLDRPIELNSIKMENDVTKYYTKKYKVELLQKDENDIELRYIPKHFKQKGNITKMILMKRDRLQKKFDDASRTQSTKRDVSQNMEHGFSIKLLLNQPYSYIPKDLYLSYFDSKNFVLDVPDQMWQSICFKNFGLNHNQKDGLCLSPTSIVKSEYLSKTKNGYLEYYPKALSSFAAHFYTIYGGRLFGNTIIDRSPRSLKITGDFEKVHSSYTSDIHEDGYYRHAVSNLVSSSGELLEHSKKFSNRLHGHKKRHLESNETLYQQSQTIKNVFGFTSTLAKSNKLLILPHYGDNNVIYVGTNALFNNYGSLKFVANHGTHDMSVYTQTNVGLDELFLPSNVDFDERSMIIFFIIAFLYGLALINSFYLLTSNWKFSTMFSSYVFVRYKAEVLRDPIAQQMTSTDLSNVLLIVRSFLEHSKRTVLMQDILFSNGYFIFSLMCFFGFGIEAMVILGQTFSTVSTMDTLATSVPHNYSTFVENLSVFPQDNSRTFLITTIFCLATLLMSFIGYLFHITLNIVSYMDTHEKKDGLWNLVNTTYANPILMRSYLSFFLVNKARNVNILTTRSIDEKREMEKEAMTIMKDDSDSNMFQIWDAHTEFREHIISFVFGQIMLVVFFTSVVQLVTITVGSSFLLRLWSFLGLIVQMYLSFSGVLCIIFILRIFIKNRSRANDTIRDRSVRGGRERRHLLIFFYGSSIVMVLIFILVSISFAIFLVPYELETYQSDYGSQTIKYMVSIMTYMFLLITFLTLWKRQWGEASYIDIFIRNLTLGRFNTVQ